jgi:hypothetical protein
VRPEHSQHPITRSSPSSASTERRDGDTVRISKEGQKAYEEARVEVVTTGGTYKPIGQAAARLRKALLDVARGLPAGLREANVEIQGKLTRGFSNADMEELGQTAQRFYQKDLERGRPLRSAYDYLLAAIYVRRLLEGGN